MFLLLQFSIINKYSDKSIILTVISVTEVLASLVQQLHKAAMSCLFVCG